MSILGSRTELSENPSQMHPLLFTPRKGGIDTSLQMSHSGSSHGGTHHLQILALAALSFKRRTPHRHHLLNPEGKGQGGGLRHDCPLLSQCQRVPFLQRTIMKEYLAGGGDDISGKCFEQG